MNSLKSRIAEDFQKRYLTLELPFLLEEPLRAIENWVYARQSSSVAVKQPIFIVGSHRSGTTVLYEAIAAHPDLAYFTNASNLLPNISIVSNQLCHLLGLGEMEQERFLQDGIKVTPFTPNEGIRIWERYVSERSNYYLDETYHCPEMEHYLRQSIQKHLKYFGANRFINKNPDNSVRMRYLQKLFPDAYFIHIVRDGRAVCHSLLKVREISIQFFGADHRHATSGTKVTDWDEIKQAWDENPLVGSGLLWRAVMETIERDRQYICPSRYLEFRYEDFVSQPFDYLKQIVDFCQLTWDSSVEVLFQNIASQLHLGGRNEAWKQRFDAAEVECLMGVIGPTMGHYGYLA